jgi:hypothetical protein
VVLFVAGWHIQPMPLRWTIDVESRFMTAVATGDVTRAEVDGFLDAVMANKALGYRKLFDASRADTSMDPGDLVALGTRMRFMHFEGAMGPLALVVPTDRAEPLDRMFGMIAAADRPMRLFRNVDRAHLWIEEQVSPAAPG